MEIPTECVECVGDSICDTDVERGQGWCLVFHKALEEKLKADNSTSLPLKIGKYSISQSPHGGDSVSIYCDDGEGGGFSKGDLAKVLDKFYLENL